jgi:hypothetical protein
MTWYLRSCYCGAPSLTRGRVYAAGSCQCSFSKVWALWDSRPYFTVSGLRLPFSSPPTTRRVTVEVFDPASTGVTQFPLKSKSKSKSYCDWRSVSLGVESQLGLMTRFFLSFFLIWKLFSCPFGSPSLTRGRVCHLSVIVRISKVSIQSQSQSHIAIDGQSVSR